MVVMPYTLLMLLASFLAWTKFTQTPRTQDALWVLAALSAFCLGFTL